MGKIKKWFSEIGNRASATSAIILDPKGKLSYTGDNLNGDNIIAILGETVSEEYLTQEQILFDKKERILSAGEPLYEATEVIYEAIEQQNSKTCGKYRIPLSIYYTDGRHNNQWRYGYGFILRDKTH